MAKIDQDNKILAELDKTRSTVGKYTFIIPSMLEVFNLDLINEKRSLSF